jgi:hypothetical protein
MPTPAFFPVFPQIKNCRLYKTNKIFKLSITIFFGSLHLDILLNKEVNHKLSKVLGGNDYRS